jgi:hypothetical protein
MPMDLDLQAVEEVENQVIDKIRKQLEIESLVGNN